MAKQLAKTCLVCRQPLVKLEKNQRHSKYCVGCAPIGYELQRVKKKYGLSPEEYFSLFKKNDGSCEICGTKDFGNKKPHIDHDHKTNKVRGLLCSNCNLLIGYAGENVEVLKKAIQYLLTSL